MIVESLGKKCDTICKLKNDYWGQHKE
jgi:hypothetical protein